MSAKMYIDVVTGSFGEASDIVVFDSDKEFNEDTNVTEFFENMNEADRSEFAEDVENVNLLVSEQHPQ